jgi:serpin B
MIDMKKTIICFLIILNCFRLSVYAQQYDISNSVNDFSFSLFNQVKEREKNIVFSPLSIEIALLSCYEGASGDTKKEFEKVLHYSNSSKQVKPFLSKLNSTKDSFNCLKISNSLWIQKDYSIINNYQTVIENDYLSSVFNLDFRNVQKACDAINLWTKQQTNGLINEIISPDKLDSETKLVLTNTMYFSGEWEVAFSSELTQQDKFYSINKKVEEVDFMNNKGFFSYSEIDNFKTITLPYRDNSNSLIVILPNRKYGIDKIEQNINSTIIDKILNTQKRTLVKLTIPKFKLDYKIDDLVKYLKIIGLDLSLSKNADYTLITKESMVIDKVIHKANFEINEKRTVASASTLVGRLAGCDVKSKPPKPKVFKADHPFIFMLFNNDTKSVLFIGKYVRK